MTGKFLKISSALFGISILLNIIARQVDFSLVSTIGIFNLLFFATTIVLFVIKSPIKGLLLIGLLSFLNAFGLSMDGKEDYVSQCVILGAIFCILALCVYVYKTIKEKNDNKL